MLPHHDIIPHPIALAMSEENDPTSSQIDDILKGDIKVLYQEKHKNDVIQGQLLLPPHPDIPSSSNAFIGKSKPPSKGKIRDMVEKNSDEYIRRRQRNNVAVKKSREKTREKTIYTLQKVEELKVENDQLEAKISTLTKELAVLKELFLDHAKGFCAGGNMNVVSIKNLEQMLGCKVIRTDQTPSCSTGFNSGQPTKPGLKEVNSIDPLINAAEIELMSLQKTENPIQSQQLDLLKQEDHANKPLSDPPFHEQ